jgi:hypothetical protein
MQPLLAGFGVSFLCAAALSGCVSTYTPAVIVEQTAQGRGELSDVIARTLHTEGIALADGALTDVPILVIERAPARDERGLPQCVLVHRQSGRHWTLRDMQCRAQEDSSVLKK